jgi:Holliday junction DNA helicase RuvA
MIAYLSGRIVNLTEDSIILDVQGVGFEIFISRNWLANLENGEKLAVHTHLVVREDLMALYGFQTTEEKALYLLLLGVDGIGPKLALAVISTLSLDNIKRAVLTEQPEFFSRVPGVGKKTAQKILIHMQGKFGPTLADGETYASSAVNDQVIEALTGLGYSIVEAQTAVQSLPKNTPDTVEDKLRIALSYFDR